MSVQVEINQLDGTAVASAGTRDGRTIGGSRVMPGTFKQAHGKLVLAADGKTVEFVPDSAPALEAVVAVA